MDEVFLLVKDRKKERKKERIRRVLCWWVVFQFVG